MADPDTSRTQAACTISVVLPTRNRARLLRRAVDSVLGQTFRDLELIVVNDASTDDTAAVLAELQAQDARIRVLHREKNSGAAAARNAGIAMARGEWVAFQDDDDLWLVEKLERQMQALEAAGPETGWCLSGYVRIETHRDTWVGSPFYVRQLDWRGGIGEGGPEWSLISTPGWLVKRSVLEQVGRFDENVRSWDDWELGLRLWQATKLTVAPGPLWIQDRIQGAGLTKAERARGNDLQLIMRKHGALWAGSREVLARHWYTIGRILSLYDPAPAGRAELRRALALKPWRLKTWAAIALSYVDPAKAKSWTLAMRDRRLRKERGE
ncbi:MAG TPA: glycosyltransferase family 2 protein [Solimonas sp.]